MDDALEAYVEWREECTGVWDAYARWVRATAVDAPLAFWAYGAAVDREECASHAYANLMKRIATTLNAERADPPGCEPDDRAKRRRVELTIPERAPRPSSSSGQPRLAPTGMGRTNGARSALRIRIDLDLCASLSVRQRSRYLGPPRATCISSVRRGILRDDIAWPYWSIVLSYCFRKERSNAPKRAPVPCLLMNSATRYRQVLTEPSASRGERREHPDPGSADSPENARAALARGLGDRLGAAVSMCNH